MREKVPYHLDHVQEEQGYWEDVVRTYAKFIVSWKLNPSHVVPVLVCYR